MDKNTIIGFVLIAAVLIGFSWYNRPTEEELKAQQEQVEKAQAEQRKAEEKKQAEAAKQKAALAQAREDSTALFYTALNGTASDIVLKNEKLELTLSTKGGTVTKALIKNFKDREGASDVTLFEGKDQALEYHLECKASNISSGDLFFTMHVEGMEGLFSPKTRTMDIFWREDCKQQERGHSFENRYATLTYKEKDSGTDYLNEMKEKVNENIEVPLDWIAFKNQFFTAMMIAKTDFAANSSLTSIPLDKSTGYLKKYEANLETSFDPSGKEATELEFYYGPNDFQLLKSVEKQSTFGKDLKMERLVYLGWPLFRYINRWFTLYVFDWLTKLGLNMGIVLILITLLLKLITYPLVKKTYLNSAKMRVLKPKLEEATKEFDKPEDQMKKQQAMMQLYNQYGVSPMGGCLPMLIQMPIWIAMFNFVPNAIQLRGQSFLWIKDLSTYDPWWDNKPTR